MCPALGGKAKRPEEASRVRSLVASISRVKDRQRRLLDLYYDGNIEGAAYARENADLARQLAALEKGQAEAERLRTERSGSAAAFDQVADLLQSADFGVLWDAATEEERRTLVADLIDSVTFYPDQLTVQAAGAPPIKVTLEEVGLNPGSKSVVSEAGLEPARP